MLGPSVGQARSIESSDDQRAPIFAATAKMRWHGTWWKSVPPAPERPTSVARGKVKRGRCHLPYQYHL